MEQRYGVILLENTEIIFRVYETTDHEWKLMHYHSTLLPETNQLEVSPVLEAIGEFLTTEPAQQIEDWKICSRNYPKKILQEISHVLTMPVEAISIHREQELICKGMFTELW